jgi:hypothetical protein
MRETLQHSLRWNYGNASIVASGVSAALNARKMLNPCENECFISIYLNSTETSRYIRKRF